MPLFEPNPVYVLIRGAFRRFFSIWGTWNIVGHEHIPRSGPVIIVSNHISYLDPPLMGSAVRRTVAYMAKKELFTGNKLLAWACRRLEAFPVQQGKMDREALRLAQERLDRNWMIGIFPEGHRSETDSLQPFQQGMAMIALRSKAPVVPCGFTGTFHMLPPHSSRIRKSHIEVHFGPPLDLEDAYELEDRREALAMITARAEEAVARLVDEARSSREQWYTTRGRKGAGSHTSA